MGFWSNLGKGISAVGSVVAPFTGPLAPLVAGGTGFLGGTMQGGWKQGLKQGGINAATSFIPGLGAGGGAAAGTAAKTGLKAGLTQGLKSAATNPNLYASFLPQGSAGAPGGGGGGGGGQGGSMYQNFLPQRAGSAFNPASLVPGGGGGVGSVLPGGGGTPTRSPYAMNAASTAPGGVPGGGTPGNEQINPGGSPGFWDKWGPVLGQAGAAGVGIYAGKKMQESAQKRSPEEQAALGGAQGVAGQAAGMAGELYGESKPYLRQAGNYFSTLLRGNRAAMQQAVAGPTAQLTDVYRGAERGLERSGVRGAQRQVAAGDLARDRASKIAGLTTGIQPYAAEQLGKLGTDYMQNAAPLYGTAGNVYENLLGAGARNREYARGEGEKGGKAIGGLVRDIGQTIWNSRGPKQGPIWGQTIGMKKPDYGGTMPTSIPGMGGAQIPTIAGMPGVRQPNIPDFSNFRMY
jgi:hypothetical protein